MTDDIPLPTPIKHDSRSCYGVVWFATEEEATIYGNYIRERGDTYNGGFYDGMPCGRDTGMDLRDADGTKVAYAVTTA
jgi:hypothetical protein